MYTGTLIEELIATVERVERAHARAEAAELELWLSVAPYQQQQVEPELLGVA